MIYVDRHVQKKLKKPCVILHESAKNGGYIMGLGPSGSLGYILTLTDPSLTYFDGSVVVFYNRKSLSIKGNGKDMDPFLLIYQIREFVSLKFDQKAINKDSL